MDDLPGKTLIEAKKSKAAKVPLTIRDQDSCTVPEWSNNEMKRRRARPLTTARTSAGRSPRAQSDRH